MKEKLIYFLTFVHPRTKAVLFNPKGASTIQYRTNHLPRIGDVIELIFETETQRKGGRMFRRFHRFDFKVLEVKRNIRACTRAKYERGSPAYFEESESFSLSVVPTTKEFTGTVRLVRQFYSTTCEKWHEWLRHQ